jgi:hypothetical protein
VKRQGHFTDFSTTSPACTLLPAQGQLLVLQFGCLWVYTSDQVSKTMSSVEEIERMRSEALKKTQWYIKNLACKCGPVVPSITRRKAHRKEIMESLHIRADVKNRV